MAYTRQQQQVIGLARQLSRGYSPKVQRALFEALAVESRFRNLNYGDRDSQGVLQQRPSTGWGPPGNAAVDIRQFLSRAARAQGGYATAGQLAQAVQQSAFPGRYDQHRAEAISLLGGAAGAGAAGAVPSAATAPADTRQARAAFVQALIASSQQTGQHRTLDSAPILSALEGLRQAQQRPAAGVSSPANPVMGQGPSRGGPSLGFLTPLAHRFGLQVTSTTGGKHVSGSYHYRRRAEDYGGDESRMAALQHYALTHPRQFAEVFYTGPGAAPYFVKNGKVYPISQLDRFDRDNHRDHVHLAR